MRAWLEGSVGRRIGLWVGIVAALISAIGAAAFPLALAPDDPVAFQLGAAGFFAGFLTVFLTALVAVRHNVEEPVTRLTERIARAEQGDFIGRAVVERPDEIGKLAAMMNRMLARITDLSATMIDTKREMALRAEVMTRVRDLGLVFDVTRILTSKHDMGDLLGTLARQLGETLGFEELAILILDETRNELVVRATWGFPKDEGIEGMVFSPGEGISGAVARSGQWLLIPDTSVDERYLHYKGCHRQDGSFLCMPLAAEDRVIGLLNVLRPRADAFTDGEIQLLASVASQAALAIANAQMFEALRRGALVDDLTGLPSRGQFAAQAPAILDGGAGPAAVLLVDVVELRAFNVAHGRRRGDEVLREIARLVRARVGETALLARAGGAQIAALCPGRSREEALALAEELRAAIAAAHPCGYDASVGVGVAVYPDDGKTIDELLERGARGEHVPAAAPAPTPG
ncbi:MAG: GAF domain-containing protein [Myxococcota bacterium]